MTESEIPSPYDGTPAESLHKLATLVSPSDYWYLRRLFPEINGLSTRVLAILFRNLILDLKAHGLDPDDPTHPDDVAWIPGHPSTKLLRALLARRPIGEPTGSKSGRDGRRGASGIRKGKLRPKGDRKGAKGGKDKEGQDKKGKSGGQTQET